MIRTATDPDNDIVDHWLRSGQTARISGLDFLPVPHPTMPDVAQCIVKGQAAVYFLRQHPQDNVWLLKKFTPSRRPSDAYLNTVHECLPGGIEFFTCTQRRLVTSGHVDHRYSAYTSAPCQGAGLQRVRIPPGNWVAPAGSYRSGGGGNKAVGAFETRVA